MCFLGERPRRLKHADLLARRAVASEPDAARLQHLLMLP
jgi:hypothetical protein